jgi:hypothetical protein
MVPASLGSVLFAIASAAPEVVAEKLRFVVRLSLMIGLPIMAALALGGPLLLKAIGRDYAHQATIPLLLLILTYIPGIPKAQYIAVCRAAQRVGQATIVLSVSALCDIAGVVVGGKLGGLNGVAFGYLVMQVIEGLATAPTVLRAASVKRAATGEATTARPTDEDSHRDRQLAGVAALIALASTVGASEVWGTGAFSTISRSIRADSGPSSMLPGDDEESYAIRQRAGLDALLSMATQVAPEGALDESIQDVVLRSAVKFEPLKEVSSGKHQYVHAGHPRRLPPRV